MRSLRARLTASHVAVVLVAAAITLLLTRAITPALYDRLDRGPHRGPPTALGFRQQMLDAVDLALLIGAGVGVLTATILGSVVAWRFAGRIRSLQQAAREIAAGGYDTPVPRPPERELAALAADLDGLGASLGDTEARRVRLLGDVAHELRTPLTVVGGYVEGMIDGVVPTTPEQLALISREVERMRRLSDDLTALSKAQEPAGLELRRSRIDVSHVVEEAARRLAPQAADAGVTLSVEAREAWAEVDGERVAQIVTNLVGNALRAVNDGGRVEVLSRPVGDRVEVTVSDDGEGLAADDLERVFERFYRVHRRSGDERGGGSGIGLTIARQIARAHGGDLVARSPGPGLGATFTLLLPALAERGVRLSK